MRDTSASTVLQSVVDGLRELVRRLENDKAQLEQKIAEHQLNIRRLEKEIANGADAQRPRRRKGENIRLIKELFVADPDIRLTMQEIAAKTQLPLSSVQAALQREGSGIVRDEFSNKYFVAQEEAAHGQERAKE